MIDWHSGLVAFAVVFVVSLLVGKREKWENGPKEARLCDLAQRIACLEDRFGIVRDVSQEQVMRLIHQGKMIPAIKLYREQHPSVGLKAAKAAVEEMERSFFEHKVQHLEEAAGPEERQHVGRQLIRQMQAIQAIKLSQEQRQMDRLVIILLLEDEYVSSRDEAAMDLADYDDPLAEQALIQAASDGNLNETIAYSCGFSLAEIWRRKNTYPEEIIRRFGATAQFGVAHGTGRTLGS